MKKFTLWLPLAALIVAGMLSAWDGKIGKHKQQELCPPCCMTTPCVWYRYIGPQPGSPGTWANFNNYTLYSPQPVDIKVECPGTQVLCAVKLRNNGPTPMPISSPCVGAIAQAVLSGVETPCIELRSMP